MKAIFEIMGTSLVSKYLAILIIALVLIAVACVGMSQIEMATGIETFIDAESKVYRDFDRFIGNFGADMVIVVAEGDDLNQLMQPENLRAMDEVATKLGSNENVISAQSPAIFVRQQLHQDPESPISSLPEDLTLETVINTVTETETGLIREELKQLLPDEKHALIMIILQGGLLTEDQNLIVEEAQAAVESAGFVGIEPIVTGDAAVSIEIESMLMSNMGKMMAVAVFMLFFMLALIFKVRGFFAWRWLPLGVVLIGIIYTLGLMGIFSIPLTMVSMAVFPILIGLGIDYGIQFHNRYDEESARGLPVAEAIKESITHIGPAVGIALVAGCLGFSALFFSIMPMIQDFGLMLIIGVICSYMVAAFSLMSILFWRDSRKKHKPKAGAETVKTQSASAGVGIVEKCLQRLSPYVLKYPFVIVPIAIILTAAGISVDSKIETVAEQEAMVNQEIPVIKSLNSLEELMGGLMSFSVLIESDDVTSPEILKWIDEFEQNAIAENEDEIVGSESLAQLVMLNNEGDIPSDSDQVKEVLKSLPPQMTSNLIGGNHDAINLILYVAPINHDEIEDLHNRLMESLNDQPEGATATLTGYPVLSVEMVKGVNVEGRNRMTIIGIVFIFAALLVLFKFRPIRAIMASLPIVLIIGWTALFMYAMGIEFTPITATFGALIMGIGVEFTILLMTRYYEEREKGASAHDGMVTAMTKIGRAVSVSAFTTIGGFAALLIAVDFPVLQDFGIVTMTNVFFALVASLMVLPAIIVWVDSRMGNSRVARFL